MLSRLFCFILLLSCSCCSFAQLQFTAFSGLVLGCNSDPYPANATIDAGSIQVGQNISAGICIVNTGASTVTLSAATVSTTDFDGSANAFPIVIQPNKGSIAIVGFNFTATAAGTKTAQLSFVDDAPGSPQTFTLSGTGFADFGLNMFLTASNVQTVTAGQFAAYTMSVTGAAIPPGPTAFTGVVILSCSSLPPGASCTFSPNAVNLAPGIEFQNLGLNISTTARPAASLHGPGKLWYSAAAVFALALAASGKRFKRVAQLACVLGLGLTISCGGGSSSGPPSPTPAGTYSISVNATSNNISHSKTIVLVVK